MKRVGVVVGLGLLISACASTASVGKTLGTIERYDPRFDRLIPPGARMEILAEGFDWTEGPVWDSKRKCVLFCDIPKNTVHEWKEGQGLGVFLRPSGYTGAPERRAELGANGMTLDPKGNLVLCQHGDRRVAKWDGYQFVTLADRYEGKRLNSPNDLVYHSSGALYFTDPPYGLVTMRTDDPAKELDFQGLFRLAPDGTLTLLAKDITRPNGIAFSPDEKKLYIASSDPDKAIWLVYDVLPDGTIAHGKVFFDSTQWVKEKPPRPGLPDGMKVDVNGNLFATGPGGLYVFTPDGTLLGRLNTGQRTANCAWGDDGSTLYICAHMYFARIRTSTRGRMP